MPITPFNWQNLPATTSPISRANLQGMETRVTSYTDTAINKFLLLPTDILQEGVIGASTAKAASISISSAGLLKFALTEGYCWILQEVSTTSQEYNENTEEYEEETIMVKELARQKVPKATYKISKSSNKIALPTIEGRWCATGICLEAQAYTAKPVYEKGVENSTSIASALAEIATTKEKALRVLDIVIEKTAGGYAIVAERDRRKWAKGGGAFNKLTSGNVIGNSSVKNLGTPVRMECSGNPIRLTLTAQTTGSAEVEFGFYMDGTAVDGTTEAGISKVAGGKSTTTVYEFTPAAGSHLFQPVFKCTSSSEIVASAAHPVIFIVDEVVKPNANNGTS